MSNESLHYPESQSISSLPLLKNKMVKRAFFLSCLLEGNVRLLEFALYYEAC